MKVVCTKIYNEIKKEWETTSPWLTIGKEYIVLQIEISLSNVDEVCYRLVGDCNESSKSPAMFRSFQFDLVEGTMPKSWVASQAVKGSLDIGPASWHAPGFWDDFYDGDPAAEQIYRREAMLIYEEAGYEVY